MGAETRATAILICGAQVDEAKNKTSLRSSSLLLRVLLEIGSCGLFMGLLILAVLATVLLPPYLLGLVVDPQ